MAGLNITEKNVKRNLFQGSIVPGEEAVVKVGCLLTHDVCGPPTIGIFHKEYGRNAKVWDRERVVIIPDHYIFTKDEKAARNVDVLREFAKEQDLPFFYDKDSPAYAGVCHAALPELGHVIPGEIIIGTDSHTTTHGALGTLSMGVGNTTGALVMGSGLYIMNTPESMKFRFDNKFPDYVMGKDVILRIIGDIGVDGAEFKSMEFCGQGISRLSLEERMSVCNMAIEAGGNGVIAPDKKTKEYVLKRAALLSEPVLDRLIEELQSDPDARYLSEHSYDAVTLEPVVAMPHSPENIARVLDKQGLKLDSAYIGSCTGGKAEDFYAAAKILHAAGTKVKIPLYIVPATWNVVRFIEKQTIDGKTLKSIFEDAGANMDSFYEPSCAACLGGPVDTYGRINNEPDHVRVSTTNRNFPNRMGSGNVILASPLTAAASALRGVLTDPREYMR
ncbi:3-isopropylmalate dehydratase large subunit [Candidatus Woesearchaeota archaeon]|nr:3-isopropylmalate dehydratase large subunit [Candidatus Woesearchaeota archaeon]